MGENTQHTGHGQFRGWRDAHRFSSFHALEDIWRARKMGHAWESSDRKPHRPHMLPYGLQQTLGLKMRHVFRAAVLEKRYQFFPFLPGCLNAESLGGGVPQYTTFGQDSLADLTGPLSPPAFRWKNTESQTNPAQTKTTNAPLHTLRHRVCCGGKKSRP